MKPKKAKQPKLPCKAVHESRYVIGTTLYGFTAVVIVLAVAGEWAMVQIGGDTPYVAPVKELEM